MDDNKFGTNDSNLRKRHSEDQQASSDSQAEDAVLTSSGRPKRRCTQKKVYLESDPPTESTVLDPDYNQENREIIFTPVILKKVQTTPTKITTSSMVIIDPQINMSSLKPDLTEQKAKYKWIDYDSGTGKVRCLICVAVNLKKWFILVNEKSGNLDESLRCHETSEEHQHACNEGVLPSVQKTAQATLLRTSPAPVAPTVNIPAPTVKILNTPTVLQMRKIKEKTAARDVYCIPMECADPIPLPGAQLRNLLARHGLKGMVNFTPDLTPAKLREDITKPFSKTFNLRTQELLQFDYLALKKEKDELTKPATMLHFDAKTVLSFVGDNEIYILLKQKAPAQNIDWKQLLFQEKKLRNLGDEEYKEVMLSVMHRLSSGKHKKDSLEEQKALVESLISDYKLNNYHQLVYVGNKLDQLVLFTEKRRLEAFQKSHEGHPDLQTTFKSIFKSYYWNGAEEWVTHQVKNCAPCLKKYGENSLSVAAISFDKIEEELKQNKAAKSFAPLAPRPPQQPAFVQRIVPILQQTAPAPKQTAPAPTAPPKQSAVPILGQTAPAATAPPKQSAGPSVDTTRISATVNTAITKSRPTGYPAAAIIPPMPTPNKEIKNDANTSLSLLVKKEPETYFEKNDLLPPLDDMGPGESDRDQTLYEEDLEQAITRNSKNSGDGSYCVNAMWAMYLLQQRGMFCDFFIMVLPSVSNDLKKPKIYGVHRSVFAAISSRVRKRSKTTIKIGGNITCEGLENLIEYCYAGRMAGIHEMTLENITHVSNTAMALDIKIDQYLQDQRPDFKKTSAKIVVTRNPGDSSSSSHDGERDDTSVVDTLI